MEIKLMPDAVFKAPLNEKPCLIKISVSSIMLVINPLIIAKIIIPSKGKGILLN